MKSTKMVGFFVVKRYAVREAEWRYTVRNGKIERYAVRKGGCQLIYCSFQDPLKYI